MPLNVRDLEDAVLYGKQKSNEWQQEFDREWNRPHDEMQIALWWQRLDPNVKSNLAAMIPDQVNEMQRLYGGGYGKNK